MLNFDLFSGGALSVSDVNRQVKHLLETDLVLEDISVEGEVSNLSKPASGHLYFTLKDAKSALKCVMWRTSAAEFQALLENGRLIIAHGRIGVFERDGIYQLYADSLFSVGQGKLFEEFIRLKEKLEKEGLFDATRKKRLPDFPEKIGIVTSASGAALQDMLNTISRRWPLAEVLLSAAAVQGVEAPASLLGAFERLEKLNPDVILIGRGGGSLEDLWAFNDESLVRRIAESSVPVVSGIGHETDFTLADFAADVRAPTPTGAAVAATPDRTDQMQVLDRMQYQLDQRFLSCVRSGNQQLQALAHRLEKAAPLYSVRQEQLAVEQIRLRLNLWADNALNREKGELNGLRMQLESLNPENVLARGYALIEDPNGKILTAVAQLHPGKTVSIRMYNGSRSAQIK